MSKRIQQTIDYYQSELKNENRSERRVLLLEMIIDLSRQQINTLKEEKNRRDKQMNDTFKSLRERTKD